LTYTQMADVIRAIAKEVKRRNPLFVNAYVPIIVNAADAVEELDEDEGEGTDTPSR
jgi:hypothetical protein